MKRIVIALGGNALQEAGKPATAESQLEVVEKTSAYIADIIEAGYDVVIAHGNGPQVGRIVLQNESASSVTPAMPFDVCGAMSQGYIGYHIQQGLSKVLRQRGVNKQVVTLVTQVVVDKNDPKFQNPSKPIGPFYTKEEAEKIAAEKGYAMKEDAGRGYRRVVASPLPVEIVELDAVKALESAGFVVVTVGGGGIPVIKNEDGTLTGTAAVIDKDLASEKLAEDLDADALVILTAVENVSITQVCCQGFIPPHVLRHAVGDLQNCLGILLRLPDHSGKTHSAAAGDHELLCPHKTTCFLITQHFRHSHNPKPGLRSLP